MLGRSRCRDSPQRGGSLMLTQGHLLLYIVQSWESSLSVAPLSWLFDSKKITFAAGLSCPGPRGARKGRFLTEVPGCEITAEGRRAEKSRALYSSVLPSSFISFICLHEISLSFNLQFAWNSSFSDLGVYSIGNRWQMKKSLLFLIAGSQALINPLILYGESMWYECVTLKTDPTLVLRKAGVPCTCYYSNVTKIQNYFSYISRFCSRGERNIVTKLNGCALRAMV